MINVVDRVPTLPGRIKLTDEQTGTEKYYTLERADEPVVDGTPINRLLFENLQNDIYNNTDAKTTFLLGKVTALSNCQELSITGLNIQKNEEIIVIFSTSNAGGGAGASVGYSILLNDTTMLSVPSYYTNSIIFVRLTSQNGQNYYTATSLIGNNSSVNNTSTRTSDTEINSISIINKTTTGIREGNTLLVYKRTS